MSWDSSWPTLEMQTSRLRLKELRKTLDELPHEPPEVGAELARFLVVRASGYVEHTFETCIRHFVEAHSHPAVARHVNAGLFRGRNPSSSTLLDRTKTMSEEWHAQLDNYLEVDDARVQRELNFMVDRRNRIAHGENESVRRRKALDLADIALDVGEFLTKLIDPRNSAP